MNWLIRIAYRNAPDDSIIAAAIRIGPKIFISNCHFLAAHKAIEEGYLIHDRQNDKFYGKDGLPYEDGFITESGQFISRKEADQFFGITHSDDMSEQQVMTASQEGQGAFSVNILSYIGELLGILINGQRYDYYLHNSQYQQFQKLLKHNKGRALAYLRKVGEPL